MAVVFPIITGAIFKTIAKICLMNEIAVRKIIVLLLYKSVTDDNNYSHYKVFSILIVKWLNGFILSFITDLKWVVGILQTFLKYKVLIKLLYLTLLHFTTRQFSTAFVPEMLILEQIQSQKII